MSEVVVQSPQINQVAITEEDNTVVVSSTTIAMAAIVQEGPQGPPGFGINDTAKVDKSIVYYNAATQQFTADAAWTVSTITDGGNF
jgi:hypothetical protein